MCQDSDIKIAGEHPIEKKASSAELFSDAEEYEAQRNNGNLKRAQELGKSVALSFIEICKKDELTVMEPDDGDLETQRILLLSFTAMAGLEKFCPNMTLANTARTALFNELYVLDRPLFDKSSDTGAFSFYYLSFRRGTDVDRRIGQTFAMLCSHDGDPIYQELGEALYCWFFSKIKKLVDKAAFIKEKNSD